MAVREHPCTKEEFDNPNLISDEYPHIVIDGLEMTAENIWNYPGDRNVLVEKLVDFFYTTGFQMYKSLTDDEVAAQLLKLKSKDSGEAVASDGSLKNSSSLCLDVCRQFCQQSFYKVKVNGTPSIEDVYKSKDLLRKVLKNRMGWCTSTETITRKGKTIVGLHPYLFDISHKMLVQGCHSSMTSANVSNFRPIIAKHLMEKHCKPSGAVLDLSAGWGARFLGAWSLGLTYFGIDPMTAPEIDGMRAFIDSRSDLCNNTSSSSKLTTGCSEDPASYANVPEVDYVIVCPPYFKLEEYQCAKNSTDVYSEYSDWLAKYWAPTVENAVAKMKPGAKFSLIMIDKWRKFELLKDMSGIITGTGLQKVEEQAYKTTRSHLTDKRKSGNTNKSTERVVTFQKA